MSRSLTRSLTLAALLALPPAWCAGVSAQDTPAPKDDALDSLLKKVEEKEAKAAEKPAATPGGGKAAKARPTGEVSGKDKELDSLLEKLGTTEDKPSPDDPRGGGGAGRNEPPPGDRPGQGKDKDKDKDKKPDPNELSGKDKDLDEHIGELAGKRRKKDRRDQDGGGPLSEVVKEMREVEQRLGKTDTGEETRKKQTQIVKRIETLIEQSRASGQTRGKPRPGKPQPGQQPGQQLSNTPGNTGGNAPFTKPLKPTGKHSMLAGKDEWGHLPPELRQEMDNVSKEEPLRSREELIRRYYLSVSKKALTRGE